MSLTPERRITPPGLSVHNLVNTGSVQERHMENIPSLRVESAERSTSSLSTQSQTSLASSKGNVLDNVYSPIATFLVKSSVGLMISLSLIVMIFGDDMVIYFSQLFGFIMIFLMVFIVSCGGYIWWMSWVHEAIDLTRNSTLMMLLAFIGSEIISTVANHMIDIGHFDSLPIDLSFYAIHTVSLFCLFASLVHPQGTSAMFAHETCIFVAFTIVMHYTSVSIFLKILPNIFCCLLVYCSCFLAMCISLVLLNHQPNISLIGLRRMIRTSIHSKRDPYPASYAGRRFSNVSLMSNLSSIRPKNSITDQSSFSGYHHYQDLVDTDGLTEANGMLGDLLIREDRLTQKGRESLKKIQTLLTIKFPRSSVQYKPRSRLGSGESDITSGGSTYGSPATRRVSLSQKCNPGSQFTTTTTSTGLPNVEKDPQERKKSLATRDRTRMSLAEGGRPSVHRLSSSPLTRQYKTSMPNISFHSYDRTDGGTLSSASSCNLSDTSNPNSEDETVIKRLNSRSDSLDVISEDDEKSVNIPSSLSSVKRMHISSDTETDQYQPLTNSTPNNNNNNVLIHFNKYIEPSPVELDVYDNSGIAILEHVSEWDFPIFEMETLSKGNILSQMAFRLFKEAGLMETFNIPQKEFVNYFRALEANYGTKTYHNRTHAADVIHATSFLLFEDIPEFSYDQTDTIEGGRQWIGNLRSKESGGNIASAFSSLEVFACYMAAAMHDFDHPGRTNAFLVATRNPLAVLYNDRSVLENHHAAASWDLLISHNNKNFLSNLESSELKRLRFLIIELILATDLKQHFEIVRDFREKFDPENGGIDWSSDIDRLQVMKMVIKMADINTPTKSLELHRSWTVRITEEFYQQHEDEMRLSLPQTIFMDRQQKEKLPAIQVSFIQNLVAPLFRACAEVGIIPGIVESSTSKGEGLSDDDIGSDDVLDDDDDDSIPDEAALIRPTKKIFSIILTNLQMNYESWKDELPKEKEVIESTTDDYTDDDTDDDDNID